MRISDFYVDKVYTPGDTPDPAVNIRAAREAMGLSRQELADILEVDAQTIQRMEMPPGAATRREPATRMIKLIDAYLSGWRPLKDW